MKTLRHFSESVLCLFALIAILAVVQWSGQKAISSGNVFLDSADESSYLIAAQTFYNTSSGVLDHAWEALHGFRNNMLKHKEPASQLVVIPLVIAQREVDPITFKKFSFMWIVPAALILYFGLGLFCRPISALVGTLLFLSSPTAIMVFSHFYQEITTIPAVCLAMTLFFYEIKAGDREDLTWLPIGVLLGLGMYTKISYVYIFMWMWLALFVASIALSNTKTRRCRLFYEGITAYCAASFWWPTHFLYVLNYMTGGYSKHGAISSSIFERLSLFFRSEILDMYGFWAVVLIGFVIAYFLILSLPKAKVAQKQIIHTRDGMLAFVLVVTGGFFAIVFRWEGMMNMLGSFVYGIILLLFAYRIFASGQQFPKKIVACWVVFFALTMILVQRVTGNNFNPRVSAAVIPLTIGSFTIMFDWISTKINTNKRYVVLIAGMTCLLLVLQLYGLSGRCAVTNRVVSKYLIAPFAKKPSPANFSVLPTLVALPDNGDLSIGYVGSGNLSPQLIKMAYSPNVDRVKPINLIRISTKLGQEDGPLVGDVVESAMSCDLVLIPKVDETMYLPGLTPLSEKLSREENAMNTVVREALKNDQRCSLIYDVDNSDGRIDGYSVFSIRK